MDDEGGERGSMTGDQPADNNCLTFPCMIPNEIFELFIEVFNKKFKTNQTMKVTSFFSSCRHHHHICAS